MAQSSHSTFTSDSGGSPGDSPGHRTKHTSMCKVGTLSLLSSQSLSGHMNLHSEKHPCSSRQSSIPPQSKVYNPLGVESHQKVTFKGVRYRPGRKKWVAEIHNPKTNMKSYLGMHSTPEEAACAYDVASTFFGLESSLNFGGHPIYSQIPKVSKELQRYVDATDLREVVAKYGKLAMEYWTMTTVPTAEPMSIDSGGISGGSSGTTSWRYKGVLYMTNDYGAEIQVPKGNKGNTDTKIRLDRYPTPLEAAFAYDLAVTCLGGGESMLNFHHPIFKQVPRILPDLSPWSFRFECRELVREFWKLAKEAGNSVPMTLVGKPEDNTDNGSIPGGLPGTSRGCPDLCPECGKTFLASQSMFLHLMDHWENQKFSPPPQSSRDSGGDSQSSGMDSRWWSMYKGVQYCRKVDVPRLRATHNIEAGAFLTFYSITASPQQHIEARF